MSDKLGPVELEFTIDGKVQEDARRLQENIGGIGTASQRTAAAMKQAIAEQRAIIKGIEDDIRKIEQQAQKAASGIAQRELVKELRAAKRALEEEKAALNDLEQDLKKTDATTKSLVTRKRELLQAIAEMEMAGKRGTHEYNAMRNELARLTDAYSDASAQARILAHDNQQLQGVISGVAGLTGALSAGVGALGLFTDKTEQFQKIQTRVQSLMAITIGLQQVANVLNKDSAFRLITVARAKQLYAAAVEFLNTRLKMNIALSKLMVATGIGAIIAGVGLLIIALQKWSQKQKEVNSLKNQFQDLEIESVKNIAREKVEINALLRVAGDYNANLDARHRAIDQLKTIMPEYNGYIDQEGRLVDNSSEALKRHIKVLTEVEKAKFAITKMAELEARQAEANAGRLDKEVGMWRRSLAMGLAMIKSIGRPTMVAEMLIADKETQLKGRQSALKTIEEEKEFWKKELDKALQDVDVLDALFGGNKYKGTGAAAKQYDAVADLQKRLLDIQAKTAQLLFDQREDNLQKRLDQVDREHLGELNKIDEFMRQVVEKYNEANKGKQGFAPLSTATGDLMGSVAQIDPASAESFEKELLQLADAYAQRRVQIQQEAAGQVEAIMKEIADSYLTEQERELQAVREKYDKMRKEVIRFQGFLTEAQEQTLQAAQYQAEASINDTWFVRTSEAFTTLFGDIEMKSSRALKQALERAKQIIEETAANLDPRELDSYMRAIANAEALLRQRNPFQAFMQSLRQYRAALNQATREDALKKMFENASGAASQISGYMSEIMTAVGELGGTTDQQQKTIEQITTAVTGAGELAMGIATGNPMQIVQGTIKLVTSGMQLMDTKGREIERNMERARKQLDMLTHQYRALERATRQALGTDVFKAQADEIRNLQNQIIATRRLLFEERRKSAKKQDENTIQSLQADLQELQFRIEDIYQDIFETITQTSIKGLADDLASSIVNAFETGADAAEAFGEVANKVLQNAVRNALKMELLEKPIAEAMKRLQEQMGSFDSAGVFQYDGLSQEEANAFREEIARIGQTYASALDELGHIFDFAHSPDKALTGAIQGVTEQTAQVLGGQMNAIRLNQAESLMLVREQLLHMAEIAINTRHLAEIRDLLKDIRDDEPLRAQGL